MKSKLKKYFKSGFSNFSNFSKIISQEIREKIYFEFLEKFSRRTQSSQVPKIRFSWNVVDEHPISLIWVLTQFLFRSSAVWLVKINPCQKKRPYWNSIAFSFGISENTVFSNAIDSMISIVYGSPEAGLPNNWAAIVGWPGEWCGQYLRTGSSNYPPSPFPFSRSMGTVGALFDRFRNFWQLKSHLKYS
jgi:hypothetical protein